MRTAFLGRHLLEGRHPIVIGLLVSAGIGASVVLASCGGNGPSSGLAASVSASTTTVPLTSSTVPGTPTSPVTLPPAVTQPTATTNYPSPYQPQYDTIDSLVQYSGAIVLGTLSGSPAAATQSGSSTSYPINVQQNFGSNIPREVLTVSSAEVNAAHLSLTGTYIFFWTYDSTNGISCIVGGLRGVMSYNSATDTVTRIDTSTSSQIPQTQSLESFKESVKGALETIAAEPTTNTPPACAQSATGLSQ
jgi:hypothetical protein